LNPGLTLAIAGLTYFGIALGRWPKITSNRATVAMMGVGLLVAAGQVAFEDLPAYLDFDTLLLLFSMMILNANLRLGGFFTLAGGWLWKAARTPRAFLALEILLAGLLSALFLNDTICLVLTPLVLEMTTSAKRNPLPYLIALATAANIGSTATLTGNPQNMIVGVASGIAYLDFTAALLPVALIGLGVVWGVIVLFYPVEFRRGAFERAEVTGARIDRWMLTKTLLVVLGLLVAFLAGVPPAKAAFLAACVLLFTRRTQPHLVFAEFDWSLLVFFAGLFVVSGSLETAGLTRRLFEVINLGPGTGIWPFSAVTLVLSNLVSNVPAVLLLKPAAAGLANPAAGWLALAAASTLAGNLTLLGSVANLIVAEVAARWRVEIGFWEYTRAGALITLLSFTLGVLWLQLTVW